MDGWIDWDCLFWSINIGVATAACCDVSCLRDYPLLMLVILRKCRALIR
jgi:hypothetical protein